MSELALKQRYTHILAHAFRGLGEKSRQLLSRIAVLSDSADYATIAVLNPFLPPRPEEVPEPADSASREHYQAQADFHAALTDLEDRGLLQWDREANRYDLHPVVRAYSFEQLGERERTRAYNTIRDHFASLPPENVEEATELAQVKNSIEILRALLGAHHFEEALEFYRGALSWSLLVSIGAYHVIIELMSPLLQCDRNGVPVLTRAADRSDATNDLAIALEGVGRLEEALGLYREAIRLDLESEHWHALAAGLRNLAVCTWSLNRLASSALINKWAEELAAANEDEDGLIISLGNGLAAATTLGRLEEAEALFASFQAREQSLRHTDRPGHAKYWLARLRFFQGRLTVADLDHAEQVVAAARNLRGQHRLAALRAEWELIRGKPLPALEAIEHALSLVRRTGEPAADYLGIRALALARLGQAEAREALAEAAEVWDGRRPLFPVCAAETCLVLGDREQARAFVRQAYPLAWADGPPYVRWYELKRCRDLLADLGEPEPQLPPFDPARVQPIPFEAEIRAVIDKLKAQRAGEKTDGTG
jgi:tetratricopeptide (TPR) repeat protein